jgi:iron(III) transport system substrate-binding protein
MRKSALWLVALLASLALAQQSRPASDPQVVEAARKEGRLIIYSSTDRASAQPLLDDFRRGRVKMYV